MARLRLLLDMHIWLWSFIDPERLGKRTRDEPRDLTNELWLSPVSTWEALIWHDKGRVYLASDAREWITRNTAPFRELRLRTRLRRPLNFFGSRIVILPTDF